MTDMNGAAWISSTHRPMGFPEFVIVIASIMALNPLAMDMMLPALPNIDSTEELMEAVFSDSVSPAICMNEGCDFTCEMEPDQDAGYCEECHTNTMKAAPVLAGLI